LHSKQLLKVVAIVDKHAISKQWTRCNNAFL